MQEKTQLNLLKRVHFYKYDFDYIQQYYTKKNQHFQDPFWKILLK